MNLKTSITILICFVFSFTTAQEKSRLQEMNISENSFTYLKQLRAGFGESPLFWVKTNEKAHSESNNIQAFKYMLDSVRIIKFNNEHQLWDNFEQDRFYYSADFMQEAESNYEWQTRDSSWVIHDSSTYRYTSTGMLNEDMDYRIEGTADSLIPRRMTTYDYNEKDLVTAEENFIWFPEVKTWMADDKFEWQYNEAGDVILENYFARYDEDNELDLIQRIEYEYDDEGNQTVKLTYAYNSASATLLPSTKSLDEYNTFGIVTLHRQFSFYNDVETWVEVSRIERECNNEGKVIEQTTYIKPDSELIPKWKDMIVYYADDGRVKEKVSMDWDADSLVWNNNDRRLYIYDDTNNTLQFTYYRWKPDENAVDWTPYLRELIYFNERGQISNGIYFNWDQSAEMWWEIEKIEFTYDHEENMTLQLMLQKDKYNNTWDSVAMNAYSFSYDARLNEILIPFSLGELPDFFTGMLTESTEYVWDDEMNQWEGKYRYNFNYSMPDFTDNVLRVVSSLNVYPNPASQYIIFDLEDRSPVLLDLYTTGGKKILTVSGYSGDQINVDHLKSGLHIYHLRTKKTSYSGKLLIR